jgi:hypothetical protein
MADTCYTSKRGRCLIDILHQIYLNCINFRLEGIPNSADYCWLLKFSGKAYLESVASTVVINDTKVARFTESYEG